MTSHARAIRRTGSLREQTSYRPSQIHSKNVDNLSALWECRPQVIHRLTRIPICQDLQMNRDLLDVKSLLPHATQSLLSNEKLHKSCNESDIDACSLVSPSLSLEMDWICCPNSRHRYVTTVAIWIALQLIAHRSRDRLCLAAHFTSEVIFSHGRQPFD
jgi:hypothetical protein